MVDDISLLPGRVSLGRLPSEGRAVLRVIGIHHSEHTFVVDFVLLTPEDARDDALTAAFGSDDPHFVGTVSIYGHGSELAETPDAVRTTFDTSLPLEPTVNRLKARGKVAVVSWRVRSFSGELLPTRWFVFDRLAIVT